MLFQSGRPPEDEGEGGHQEAVPPVPVPHPRKAGLQGAEAAPAHPARQCRRLIACQIDALSAELSLYPL